MKNSLPFQRNNEGGGLMDEHFFSNRELYNLIQETAREMAELKKEIAETRAIIRDYNGLRKKIIQIEARVGTIMWVVSIIIPAIGVFIALLNYLGNQ